MQEIKLGRNDPCHCGSGKKYMHCCRRKDIRAKVARRAAERPEPPTPPPSEPDEPEPSGPTSPVSSETPPPPEPATPPPPDPHVEALNARWEEFEAQDYEGRIRLFLQTLDEEELMDDEMAFEMLNLIYYESVERDERERFDGLVDRLREQLPDVYAHNAHYYLDWLITNALATGQSDAIPALANEIATTAGEDIDTLNNVIDQLAYHGHLATLVEVMRIAWPQVKDAENIVPWGIQKFAAQAVDFEVFHYLEQHATADPKDPELLANLEFYFEVDQERFARYLALLIGQLKRRWTMDDFEFKPPREGSYGSFDEEDEDDEAPDEGRQNLFDLSVEFLGYLRREESVPYTKGELGREQIQRYLLERHDGELEPRESPFETAGRPKRRQRKRKSRKPRHVLCPDRGRLDRYLGRLLNFINPQRYKAAATLELVPAWLRFLESRQLIDAEERSKTMLDLRGLDTELLKVWQGYPADPALQRGLEGWRDE